MPHILIADDHAIVRRGLKEMLIEAFPSVEIEEASNAEELMQLVITKEWDLVISDLSMPGRTGLQLLYEINKEFSMLPVLILSMYPEEDYAVRVFKAGAWGYLNKDKAIEELAKAVNQILRGRKYITPLVAEKLASELMQNTSKKPHEILSDRESEVFKLLAQGKTTKTIAEQLSLSPNTISTFRRRILAKMNKKTNADLVSYAVQHKMI